MADYDEKHMKMTFQFWRGASDRKMKCRVSGNPIALVLIVFAVILVFGFAISAAKYMHDSYFPYEGRVLAIETSWLDWFVFEDHDYEHLVIRTPEEKTIDRFVSKETRSLQCIKVGDYVIKVSGFLNRPTPQGKSTTQEILDKTLLQGKTSPLNTLIRPGRQ